MPKTLKEGSSSDPQKERTGSLFSPSFWGGERITCDESAEILADITFQCFIGYCDFVVYQHLKIFHFIQRFHSRFHQTIKNNLEKNLFCEFWVGKKFQVSPFFRVSTCEPNRFKLLLKVRGTGSTGTCSSKRWAPAWSFVGALDSREETSWDLHGRQPGNV